VLCPSLLINALKYENSLSAAFRYSQLLPEMTVDVRKNRNLVANVLDYLVANVASAMLFMLYSS